MEAEVPDGAHLDFSRDTDGAYRGTLRDDNNKLIGHAELFEVSDDEDESDVGEGSGLGLGGALAGLALVGLTIGAVAAASAVSGRKERRREEEWQRAEARRNAAAAPPGRASAPAGWYDIGAGRQQWWDGQGWTEHVQDDPRRASAPEGWYDDGSGRHRWFDGQEWTDHFADSRGRAAQGEAAVYAGASESAPATSVVAARQQPVVSMSSAEWQERVRAMLLARAFSEEQWRLISRARIEDGDDALLRWQSELAALTPQEFADRINAVVDAKAAQRTKAIESATAGWYDNGSGQQRWWDGHAWTDRLAEERVPVAKAATPAGWYDDGSGRLRWWDGQGWTGHRA